jgi:hypothetical protein
MMKSPFFIVGYERSGTTLMAAALDRHSQVAVPPETHFFMDLCPAAHARETGDPAFMVSHFFRGNRSRDLNLNPDELLNRMKRVEPTWGNLLLEALNLYAEQRGKARFGEKTPRHWRCLAEILNLYPESKAIWVVRDGRDAVASLMKMPWKPHGNIPLHGMHWRFAMEKMMGFEKQFPERILRVKFETLVKSPLTEIARACHFIGVEFEPRQIDPHTHTGVVPAWEMEWKKRVFSALDSTRIGSATRELPEEGLRLLNMLMESSLKELGYEVGATLPEMKAEAV